MLLIPAIDLKDGHCVRLKQGDMDQSTTFGEDPAAMARKWVDAGARRLHLVDLNGAFAGTPKNYSAIKSILKEVGDDIPVQLGGGIRDLDTIEKYIDGGLHYVIIGTAAVKNPGFLKDACSAFGGHIIVGLDAKDGKVATDGWSKLTGHEVVDLAKKFEDWGVESIIYTDIGRDGMLSGINIDATVKLAQALSIPVIASGGLSNMADIEQLCAVESEGVEGVICGRAIYSGDLDTIEKYIDGGLRYVIIGTAAVKNPGFLKDACSAFGGHIIVGLDAKDGKVATDGWSKLTGHEVVDLAKKFEDWGVESIIYTDIGRDGMLSGINIDATVKLAQALSIPVIASGGLSNMADIEQLCAVESEGVEGVICGRAIYSGDLDFAAAQARADELGEA